MEEKTTIQISKFLKDKLNELGKRGETYEDIIMRILVIAERR